MKGILFLVILLELLSFTFSFIPIWNIEKSFNKLTQNTPITIYENSNEPSVKLYKIIETEGSGVTDKNYINFENLSEQTTTWEDIETVFYDGEKNYYICPKGRNYLNKYVDNRFEELIPDNFNNNGITEEDNWELTCYLRWNLKYLVFQGFLNQKKITNFYHTYCASINWEGLYIYGSFFDYNWSKDVGTNNEYLMNALHYKNEELYLEKIKIIIDVINNKISYNSIKAEKLDTYRDFTHAYFNSKKNKFYWISVSKNNDYSSGYSTGEVSIDSDLDQVNIEKFTDSPLNFLKNIQISKMDMIRNTRFVYYEVISNEDNKKYYGIIDITLNKVIFNTDSELDKFKPLKDNSMLAIIGDSAYQICAIKDSSGNCISECPSEQELILDTEKGNYCGSSTQCDNYKLLPENICIETCNTSIYTTNENKECGLCQTLYQNIKPYKIINEEECVSSKPDDTFYISEELQILQRCNSTCETCESYDKCNKCKPNYTLRNGKCITEECYETCELCSEKSDNKSEQKCTECHDSTKYLQIDKGNCIDECLEGYYVNDTYCSNCHKNCKTCLTGAENDNGTINENCNSCQSGKYLIEADGFHPNCVDNCPTGTKKSGNKCILSSSNNTNTDDEDSNKKNSDYMIWIFIILIGIILLIISLCICKKHCARNKSDGEIINDINTELRENNNFVE